jgi:hypothetical protein
MFLRKVGWLSSYYTALNSRPLPMWEPRVLFLYCQLNLYLFCTPTGMLFYLSVYVGCYRIINCLHPANKYIYFYTCNLITDKKEVIAIYVDLYVHETWHFTRGEDIDWRVFEDNKILRPITRTGRKGNGLFQFLDYPYETPLERSKNIRWSWN